MKRVYIGLDVHKATICIALAFWGVREVIHHGKTSADMDTFLAALRRMLKKYKLEKKDAALCYEAGPTGFVLARRLRSLDYTCEVVAPSLIPTRASDRVKTDRRDARKLASLFRAGELEAVHVPDVDDEVIRDIGRARTDAVDVQTRSKQQLSALLLRNGYHYTGKSNWSEPHKRYLRELVLPDRAQKFVLEEYLQRIDTAAAQVLRLEGQMQLELEEWTRRPFVEALQGFRGFQFVASMVVTGELGDLLRFEHPRQLMAYLGLVPSEDTSGDRRRQGSITKTGNSHVRWMLVEVAHAYRLPPKISSALSRRQEGLSAAVRDVSWRAQNRLYKRFHRLTLRGLHRNKVIIAVARELTAFIWELARIVYQEQRQQKAG